MAKLKIVPLGGAGEIGKNMLALQYGDDILIIDAGIMFPENDMLGVDFIIPDWQYLRSRFDQVRAILITHGHEDHIGALGHLLQEINVPIYATPLTQGLISSKLQRFGDLGKVDIRNMRPRQDFQIGPFIIEPFHVCHSIPDCVGFGITTPAGLIVHSGDYKFDHTPVDGKPPDFAKLAEFANRGVLALLADSTNSDKQGWTPSETLIDGALDRVFREAPGRVIVASFASLISRIQQVINAAGRNNRQVAISGRTMVDNTKIARQLGYLDFPPEIEIDINAANKMSGRKVVVITTGSQGEPMAGLGRLALNRHSSLSIRADDTVVLSSHPIPGNEEMVYRTINYLFQRGAHVIYGAIAPVHVSGHASREEQKLLINLVRPKYLVPIHGELRHLHLHSQLAQEIGMPAENIAVVENGFVLNFEKDSMIIGERVPGSYVFVDGSVVGDIGPSVLRDREILSQDGFVIAVVPLDHTNKVVGQPELVTRGFVFVKDTQWLVDDAQNMIIQQVNGAKTNNEEEIRQLVVGGLRKFFYAQTHRRPMVFAVITRALTTT
ncbi:MAG: ribonuclease J [Anaerolineales bacterium]|nr:ribonuclease J [Anaerolineales bacterium]